MFLPLTLDRSALTNALPSMPVTAGSVRPRANATSTSGQPAAEAAGTAASTTLRGGREGPISKPAAASTEVHAKTKYLWRQRPTREGSRSLVTQSMLAEPIAVLAGRSPLRVG